MALLKLAGFPREKRLAIEGGKSSTPNLHDFWDPAVHDFQGIRFTKHSWTIFNDLRFKIFMTSRVNPP